MASLLVFQFSLLFMWIPRYLHPGTTPTSCPRTGLCGCPLPSKLHHHLSEADDSSQTTPQNHPLLLCTPNTSNHLTVVRVILQTADVSEKCLKLWFVLLIYRQLVNQILFVADKVRATSKSENKIIIFYISNYLLLKSTCNMATWGLLLGYLGPLKKITHFDL